MQERQRIGLMCAGSADGMLDVGEFCVGCRLVIAAPRHEFLCDGQSVTRRRKDLRLI